MTSAIPLRSRNVSPSDKGDCCIWKLKNIHIKAEVIPGIGLCEEGLMCIFHISSHPKGFYPDKWVETDSRGLQCVTCGTMCHCSEDIWEMACCSDALIKILKSPNLLREGRGQWSCQNESTKEISLFFFNLWEGSSKNVSSESQVKKIRSNDTDIWFYTS